MRSPADRAKLDALENLYRFLNEGERPLVQPRRPERGRFRAGTVFDETRLER